MKKNEKLTIWLAGLRTVWAKNKGIVLILAVGLILLAASSLGGEKETETATAATAEATFDLEATEQKYAQALSEIDGAGKVTVVLSVQNGTQRVVAQDNDYESKDGDVEKNSSVVVISKGSGTEETVTLQEIYPKLQGALVICSGGDDPAVKLKLVEAMSALTGLGADKISICKGK